MFFLKESYPLAVEIDTTKEQFLEILQPHLSTAYFTTFATKELLKGTADEKQVNVIRLKKFGFFSTGIFIFRGEIKTTGNTVTLAGALYPKTLYRYNAILSSIPFLLLGILVVGAQDFPLAGTLVMLAITGALSFITKKRMEKKPEEEQAYFIQTLKLIYGFDPPTVNLRRVK